jgi:hypothetical protein
MTVIVYLIYSPMAIDGLSTWALIPNAAGLFAAKKALIKRMRVHFFNVVSSRVS